MLTPGQRFARVECSRRGALERDCLAKLMNNARILCADSLRRQLLSWIKFNPSMDNFIHSKVRDEITCQFLNFNFQLVLTHRHWVLHEKNYFQSFCQILTILRMELWSRRVALKRGFKIEMGTPTFESCGPFQYKDVVLLAYDGLATVLSFTWEFPCFGKTVFILKRIHGVSPVEDKLSPFDSKSFLGLFKPEPGVIQFRQWRQVGFDACSSW